MPAKTSDVTELYRYLSPRANGLLSVRSNGEIYRKTPFSSKWSLYATKRSTTSMDEWIEKRMSVERNLKFWQRVQKLPSEKTLQRFMFDGVAESTAGNTVEPDGWDDEGSPSWLLALGMI